MTLHRHHRHHSAGRDRHRGGFSLIELLLAIFILGVGIISVAAVFPAGIIQQRRTQDDVFGPVVAEAALSTIRGRVSQGDFGTFEEFGLFGPDDFSTLTAPFPNDWLAAGDAYTQPGDWPWIRPSMAAVPADSTPADREYAGDIDIFSARVTRAASNFVPAAFNYPSETQWDQDWRTSEFSLFGGAIPLLGQTHPQGSGTGTDPGAFLFGVPYNRAKFDLFGNGQDPLVTVTQEERFWPGGSGFTGQLPRPQYAWDCMFRRFQGRVQVAIFVYRLKVGNASGGFAVSQDAGSNSQARDTTRPPMPARVDFPASINGAAYRELNPLGDDTPPELDAEDARRNIVKNTNPNFNLPSNSIYLDPYFEGWQEPGQWFLDPYGRTHRVLQGRRNKEQGPVRLSRPIPGQAPSTALYNPAALDDGWDGDAAAWQTAVDTVRSIWFVPPVDRRGISLTPVYVTVRDL